MPRKNGTPGAAMGVPQMNTPELPPLLKCRHSTSRMKFSYCRVVRSAPVGRPVQWMTPSRTLHVSGAQFAFTQPVKSRPLKSGTKPLSSAASAEVAAIIRSTKANRFMRRECHGPRTNARGKEKGAVAYLSFLPHRAARIVNY